MLGTLELPDYPIHEGFGINMGEHIPGEALHDYLYEHASNFGLLPRLRLRTAAVSAERMTHKDGVTWSVVLERNAVDEGDPRARYKLLERKLIIATGLQTQSVS